MPSQTSVPSWLDKQFIEQALKGAVGEKIKVKNIQVRAATLPGDNYCSIIYRVTAEYNPNDGSNEICTKTLIVKAIPEEENMKKLLIENDAFTREIEVLWRIVPELHRLLNASSNDKPVLFAPRCYFSSGKPHQKLVMEDLTQSGFKMASRETGLDLEHSRLVVGRLGQFHAATVALQSQEPNIFDNFLTHIYVRNGESMKNFVSQSFKTVAEKVQMWPEDGQKYYEKLHQLSITGAHRLEKTVQRDDQEFNVLTHGDAWTNNMMFRYDDDGKVSDIIFLDFQCSYYGSPVLDLQYFLYTSPTPEVRSRHMEELVESYHSSLYDSLTRLGCGRQCPSVEAIQEKMTIRNFMGVFAVFCIKPITSAKPDNTPDLGEIIGSPSENSASGHLSEDYNREIKTLLPILEKDGLLD